MKIVFILISFSFIVGSSTFASKILDGREIEYWTGAKGGYVQNSNIFKVTFPLASLKVNSAGVQITPPLGLQCWASFMVIEEGVEVIGEIVLFEDQVSFAMREALENGLNVTALYNYSLWTQPTLMIMRVAGKGKLEDLATAVGKIFHFIKKTATGSIWKKPPGIINPEKSSLTIKNVEDVLKHKSVFKDGVYKFEWGKTTQLNGHVIKAPMGVATWAAFAGTDKEAVMLGDVAIEEHFVQNVLKIFLKHNIFVTSLQQRLIGESPRIIFIRYMKRGAPHELAQGLKEVLELDNSSGKEAFEEGEVQK